MCKFNRAAIRKIARAKGREADRTKRLQDGSPALAANEQQDARHPAPKPSSHETYPPTAQIPFQSGTAFPPASGDSETSVV